MQTKQTSQAGERTRKDHYTFTIEEAGPAKHYIIRSKVGVPIAATYVGISKSDAALLAAAPEMLAALEEILEGAIPSKRDFLMTAYAKNLVESAIKKATL